MNIIVLSCYKASLLIEKSQVQSLSFLDKLQLSMHLKICYKCSEYQKQSLFIENILNSNKKNIPNPTGLKLSPESKSLIQSKINQILKKN